VSPELWIETARLEELAGDPEAARSAVERAQAATGGADARALLRLLALSPEADRAERLERFVAVGRAAAEGGDEDWGNPLLLTGAEALRGRTDEAIAWLSEAVDRGFLDYRLLRTDSLYASLRDDRRFVALTDDLERRVDRMRRELETAPVPWNEATLRSPSARPLTG
jgi:hypothetical protein